MLQYICQNPNCSAPENKKGKSYPAAMDCSFCDEPLVQSVQLDETEITLLKNLPYLIAYPLQDTFQQSDYEKKLHRLAYTFNNFLKYLGLISISEFIHSDFKSRKMIDLFESNIGEPSFGRWNQFIRESYALLFKEKVKLVFPEVYKFYQKSNEKKFKIEVELIDDFGDVNYSEKTGMTAIDMLINFRNKYLGHGTPLNDKQAKSLWDFYYPIFKDLLQLMTAQLALLMYKKESNSCWKLQSTEITETDALPEIDEARVWLADEQGRKLPLIPFFIIPTLLGDFERESKLMVYEAYNGQSMKFFSPENIVKETSGEILQRLKLLLREKQKEVPFSPENFGRAQFLERLKEENTWVLETLLREKKIIEGVYQTRQAMEIKLREWIGARANIFFIAAEAGSGKTNLLAEMLNQYKERNIPAIFLRAARMQKDTLREELAYRLNIDENHSLEDYKIAGTQAEPSIILLDGLNEAKNSEALWDEILQLSKQFEPGALKFIIGNRANAKDDLNRYPIAEADEQLLYGEKKENEKGLYAYAHWLTPMDMQEMKGAWDHYCQLKKGIYRPNFDFDKIAQFDRGIYNQISNPLVMRLFLELYHGKSLPKKGRHLNIWKDWFNSFTAEEQSFMQKLAALIWENGANELLFDSVQKSESMKAFFADEKSKIPYQRLLKNGWISRYSKDLDAYIGFTVEGLLLYILGLHLYNQSHKIDLAAVEDLMQSGKKLKKAALDSFLAELAQRDEMELITALIDAGGDKIDICTTPLLLSMKNRGVKATLETFLENATEHDWEALFELDERFEELQLDVLRKEFLSELIQSNDFKTKKALWLGLKAIEVFDRNEALYYLQKINQSLAMILVNEDLLLALGEVEEKFGNYDKAIEYYEKAMAFYLKINGEQHPWMGQTYDNLGNVWRNKGEYDRAIECFEKSIAIKLKVYGVQHPFTGNTFNNFGLVWLDKGDYDKAIEFFEKSLAIKLKIHGDQHSTTGVTYVNLGIVCSGKDDYDKAIDYYEKAMAIFLKVHGEEHTSIGQTYHNLGEVLDNKGDYNKAIEYYEKAMAIFFKVHGEEHPSIGQTYRNLGNVWRNKGEYDKAIEYYEKSLAIKLKVHENQHPSTGVTYIDLGVVYSHKSIYDKAIEYYEKAMAIFFKVHGEEHRSIGQTYNNLGLVYSRKGEYYKAIEYYEKALTIFIKVNGDEHSSIGDTHNNLGLVYSSKGDYDKAIEYYEKSLAIKLKVHKNKHPSIGNTFNNMGIAWSGKRAYDKAIEYFEKSLAVKLKVHGDQHFYTGDSYNNLGFVWGEKGNYDNAIEYYEKAMAIFLKIQGDRHHSLVKTYNNLGGVWYFKGDYYVAIEYYKKSLAIILKIHGDRHPTLVVTYKNIAQCYESLHNKAEAFSYYLQAAEIRKEQLGIDDPKTIEAMDGCRRLAKELDREGDMPDWMK